MTLEMMKELFGVTHVGEEEVPNVKHMRIREEEVSSSLPVTIMVPPEEEEVPVSQGPADVVPPREEVPPEEEEVPAPPVAVPPQGSTIAVPPEEEVMQGPPITVPPEEEEVPAPLSWSCRKEGDALSRYRPW
jgi:hypothetical protein